jgi:3-phytase
LQEVASKVTGRTKPVTAVYDVGGQDYAVTIASPTSLLRVFELPSFNEVPSAAHKQLGDWSAICPWKSRSGNQYIYLFGKNQAVQYLLRQDGSERIGFTEVGLHGHVRKTV